VTEAGGAGAVGTSENIAGTKKSANSPWEKAKQAPENGPFNEQDLCG